MNTNDATLTRSNDRMIAGVIGGLAEYFGIEPTLFRLAVVFFVVATGLVPGIATYVLGLFLMPDSVDTAASRPRSADAPSRSEKTSVSTSTR